MRPNNSFKPNLLRYTNNMAEKACHVVASATQVGLTQALGATGEIIVNTTKTFAITFAALAALAMAAPAYAAKTYTPAQLRQMVNAGNPPRQGSPSTQKQSVAFSSCVSKVKGIVASISGEYPAKTIVNSSIMHMAKVWTNDAAMTLTCSGPDQRLVITTAKYL